MSNESSSSGGMGIIGCVLAVVLSAFKWHSVGWAILHGLLGWIYVVYFIFRYGWRIA
jgi:hypothetical protein